MKKIKLTEEELKGIVLKLYLEHGNGKPINIQSKPVRDTLKKEKLPSVSVLLKSIKQFFGSKRNLDTELGFDPIHKEWDELLLEKEYGAECRNHGNVALSYEFLCKIGRSDISNTFARLRIDKNEFDKRLGFKPLQRNTPWTDEEIPFKFKEACDEHNEGKPLSDDQLIKLGHGDLNAAIHAHFDSKYELYELLDMGFIRRGHWTFDDYLNDYLQSFKDCGNRSLSQRDLKDLGKGYLNNWINNNFNSKDDLDKLCGAVSKTFFRLSNGSRVRSRYEVKLGNFLIHNKISFKCDRIIDQRSRIKYRYDFLVEDIDGDDVYVEIWGYKTNRSFVNPDIRDRKSEYIKKTKNKKAFYSRRNLRLISIDGTIFENYNANDLQDFFKKILISKRVKLNNFKTLSSPELLNAESDAGFNEGKVYNFYSELCLENGDKPISVGDLGEMGYGGLAQAIPEYYPGGKKQLDTDLGYKHMRSLTFTLDEIKDQLKDIVKENGGIPLQPKELKNIGKGILVSLLPKYKTNLKKIYAELGYVFDYVRKTRGKLKKRIKFLKENGSDIIENYNKYGSKKTAELYGVEGSTIGRWIKDCGGELKKHKFNTINKEDVAKNLKKLGVDKSAELYSIAKITFYGWVSDLNLTHLLPRDQNKKTKFLQDNSDDVLEYARKYGVKESAKKYGFHYNTIYKLAKKKKQNES